jgi:transposase
MPLIALQFMLEYLDGRPTAYLDEVALALFDRYDIDIDPVTVWRYLKRHRWSRKVTIRNAAQRNAPLRARWHSKAEKWPADKLCFIDETASCEKTGWRRRGWSPKGLKCTDIRSCKREERWSVLPALTIYGLLLEPLIIQGSVTREAFVWWLVNKVIPYLPPSSIIIMDNCSIHHNLGLDELLELRGLTIEYLPPYSPDYNPIELVFQTLKLWVLRHFGEVELYEDFGAFMDQALSSAMEGQDFRSYYRTCGYEVKIGEV